MTNEPVSCEELEQTREDLIQIVHASFQEDDKNFLLSVKRGEPQWNLLPIKDIDQLPAVRWKLMNLARLPESKRSRLLERLNNVLSNS